MPGVRLELFKQEKYNYELSDEEGNEERPLLQDVKMCDAFIVEELNFLQRVVNQFMDK